MPVGIEALHDIGATGSGYRGFSGAIALIEARSPTMIALDCGGRDRWPGSRDLPPPDDDPDSSTRRANARIFRGG
jgi:hypothetical protein